MAKGIRVMVTGGRSFRDVGAVWRQLDRLLPNGPITLILGGATGADQLAHEWANAVDDTVTVLVFPADWGKHGRAAGPIRNQQMIDKGKPNVCIAFPGGRGTADCVRRAKAAGIPVREVS